MSIALEARGLRKGYVAGTDRCRLSVDVLRGIDLCIAAGEAVAIVGLPGAGKSTLLLCLAGLVTPDAGQLRWFGDGSRAASAERTVFHVTATDLMRTGRMDAAHVHLVDLPERSLSPLDIANWIESRCDAGDAVVIAARESSLFPVGTRVLAMSGGKLRQVVPKRARVAEAVAN